MSSPDPNRRHSQGPFAHGLAWLAASLKYLKARAELAKIEAKEAGRHYGIAAGMLMGALILFLFGYPFLIVAAVFGIATLFNDSHAWMWVMAVTALLHFAGALVLALLARKRFKTPAFPATLEELKHDQTCLTNLANNRS